MKFPSSTISFLVLSAGSCLAFTPSNHVKPFNSAVRSAVVEETVGQETSTARETLTNDIISKLRFREAQKELETRDLDASGTLTAMRNRLRQATIYNGDKTSHATGVEISVIDEHTLNKVSLIQDTEIQECSHVVFSSLKKGVRKHWYRLSGQFRSRLRIQ